MSSKNKDSVERTGTAGSGQESDKVAAAYQQAIEELKKLSSLECRPPKEKLIELLEIVLFQHNKQKVELDAAQVEIKQLEAENAKLKKDLADFTVSYNKNLRRWVDSANNKAAQVAELEAANSELRTHNTEQRQQIAELKKQLADVDYTAVYLKGKKDGEAELRAAINNFITKYQADKKSV
jgi:predicted O-linked N-acetylglucosamine transferase (SPINDLY family)